MPDFIAAIDQGTTSTRCMIVDHAGTAVALEAAEHRQITPRPGWVEHAPVEIWERTQEVVLRSLESAGIAAADLAAVGITNQRETTVVWDKQTGEPLHNAIVWMDTRNGELVRRMAGRRGGQNALRSRTGLPFSTYFAGLKLKWLIENDARVRDAVSERRALFGTVDSWLIWNLTGGVHGGRHLTDVTNASRTMLMDLERLDWDSDICDDFDIPLELLPRIGASSGVLAQTAADSPFGAGIPIAGVVGDQQAAMIGQVCFDVGDVKNTYGTGCFVLLNTGTKPRQSAHGLITTVCYRLGDQPAVYALEGSIAMAGALVQWLRDNIGIIDSAPRIEELARSVDDNGDVYIVPAFSGLYAPYWRQDARGVIVGLTRHANKGHIARAALEATAYQTRDVLEAMRADAGVALGELRVDGGMVGNELLMQFQADVLGTPVVRPAITETTALGAAYAAGLGVGFWSGTDEVRANWSAGRRWQPEPRSSAATTLYERWQQAVTRTFGWVE
ncbi:MAG: glycerol kinase GlpK [Chitinivibrionales bacterium]|nr:glycerol kinase GlpK [Chitinivibrionales bacterium]